MGLHPEQPGQRLLAAAPRRRGREPRAGHRLLPGRPHRAHPRGVPARLGHTQNNLGNAYRRRLRGDAAENQEAAIACYQAALTVLTRAAYPYDWATTTFNLALAYADQAKLARTRGDADACAALRARALETMRATLDIFTAETYAALHERALEAITEIEGMSCEADEPAG